MHALEPLKTYPQDLSITDSKCVEVLVRQDGISESEENTAPEEWATWVAAEERRRTIFAAYVLSSLHNINFNIPPLILNHELDLLLPDYSQPVRYTPRLP
jgi:hypothetical protein